MRIIQPPFVLREAVYHIGARLREGGRKRRALGPAGGTQRRTRSTLRAVQEGRVRREALVAGRTEGLPAPGRRRPVIVAGADQRLLHRLSIAAVLVAAVVAAVVAVVRDEAPTASPSPVFPSVRSTAAAPPLRIQVALPGVGAGAPASVADLTAAGAAGGSDVALIAAHYAHHLAGDLALAPAVSVVAPDTADAVQVALSAAGSPQLFFEAGEGEIDVLSESVLAARLDLGPDEALPSYFTYEIQRGDTVDTIARVFGLQPESVLVNNFEIGDGGLLPAGGVLTIPTRDGLVYNVRQGDTLFDLIDNYAADLDATLAFEGNGLAGPDRLIEGSTILLVGGSASLAGRSLGISEGPVFAIPDFGWPMGGILTTFFGAPRGNRYGFHTGIDLSAPTGTFIGAAAPGTVVQAGWEGSFGNLVTVDHGGGVVTRYAHMSHIDVFLGEAVDTGSLIGFVGNTGLSFGAHLHFEIIMGGTFVDPLVWLNS